MQNCIRPSAVTCPECQQSFRSLCEVVYLDINAFQGVCVGADSAANLLPFEVCAYSRRFDSVSHLGDPLVKSVSRFLPQRFRENNPAGFVESDIDDHAGLAP